MWSQCDLCQCLVLCAGPCGGKTTASARIRTFFENLGWKVMALMLTASPVKWLNISPCTNAHTQYVYACYCSLADCISAHDSNVLICVVCMRACVQNGSVAMRD